ncbi:rRNA methyltransferase [Raphidocelis subcapitata]|uniref:rRNA methyltransferase 1, mitochondrial n=1 Tax=Raphidocelis subcapitata TaxID=307507 RepID=A0A2V0P283_9CHLO|nr:rRNA methyltransferase [Raphidocelis subcapitata]|eukprot:GBF91307.1 rRNA methyltransferase [Raphidocelis subcapitata]
MRTALLARGLGALSGARAACPAAWLALRQRCRSLPGAAAAQQGRIATAVPVAAAAGTFSSGRGGRGRGGGGGGERGGGGRGGGRGRGGSGGRAASPATGEPRQRFSLFPNTSSGDGSGGGGYAERSSGADGGGSGGYAERSSGGGRGYAERSSNADGGGGGGYAERSGGGGRGYAERSGGGGGGRGYAERSSDADGGGRGGYAERSSGGGRGRGYAERSGGRTGGRGWARGERSEPRRDARPSGGRGARYGGDSDDEDDYGAGQYGGGDDYGSDDDGEEQFMYPARPSKSALREQLFGDVLYGVAPVYAALAARRRTAHVLYVQEGAAAAARKDGRAFQACLDLARDANVAVRTASKHDLNMLSENRPHQGLLLDCSPLDWERMDRLPDAVTGDEAGDAKRWPVWLALDEVVDPQNLGAMLRSAHCLGADGVLASAKNCAPLSAAVSKASAGALEVMTLHNARNLPRTLADAAERGWAVVGAAAEREAAALVEFAVDRPTVLVMGNEGSGLRTNVRRACTSMVRIEMGPQPRGGGGSGGASGGGGAEVDSLNVSVAAGILLHHFLVPRPGGGGGAGGGSGGGGSGDGGGGSGAES